MPQDKNKAKRKLSDISFEHEEAHIALTHKDQGFSANGKPYAIVLKNANQQKDIINKIQQVQTTQELPDFLRTFFDLDWDKAEVLARLLGYSVALKPETELERYQEDNDWYDNYYKSELASYSILKALRDTSDFNTVLSSLAQEDKDKLNKDILDITKTLKNMEEIKKVFQKTAVKADPTASGNEANSLTEKSLMSDQKNDAKISEEIQKQLSSKDAALAEALAQIEKLTAEKAAKVLAEKTAKIKAAVADEGSHELLLKAALSLDEADFDKYVKVLEVTKASVEKSLMFTEIGASGSTETPADKASVQKAKGTSEYFAAKYKKDSK